MHLADAFIQGDVSAFNLYILSALYVWQMTFPLLNKVIIRNTQNNYFPLNWQFGNVSVSSGYSQEGTGRMTEVKLGIVICSGRISLVRTGSVGVVNISGSGFESTERQKEMNTLTC